MSKQENQQFFRNLPSLWGGTRLPIDGTHVNETHLCTPSGNLTISLAELPGGKTHDYHAAISEALDDVITSYSQFTGVNKADIESSLYSNISSTVKRGYFGPKVAIFVIIFCWDILISQVSPYIFL